MATARARLGDVYPPLRPSGGGKGSDRTSIGLMNSAAYPLTPPSVAPQPIVIDSDSVIIVGHTRWKAAQRLGLENQPVISTDLYPT